MGIDSTGLAGKRRQMHAASLRHVESWFAGPVRDCIVLGGLAGNMVLPIRMSISGFTDVMPEN